MNNYIFYLTNNTKTMNLFWELKNKKNKSIIERRKEKENLRKLQKEMIGLERLIYHFHNEKDYYDLDFDLEEELKKLHEEENFHSMIIDFYQEWRDSKEEELSLEDSTMDQSDYEELNQFFIYNLEQLLDKYYSIFI